MNYQISSSQKNFNHPVTPEQLNQIIEAITEGKYSWACVLILRFVGYNPLHFIPQRTYSRLMKEHRQIATVALSSNGNIPRSINSSPSSSNNQNSSHSVSKIKDLDYLERPDKKQANIQGGYSPRCLVGL